MKKISGYSIDFDAKTITMTKAFAEKASVPSTREFRELAQLHKNFPDFDIVRRTANVSDAKKTHKGLTTDMMEKIIARSPNSDELMREYKEFVRFYGKEVIEENSGEKVFRAPYGKVKGWFLKNCPNYKDMEFFKAAMAAEAAKNAEKND